jgi:Na+/proline symporter
MYFALLTNIIVTAMLLLGGASVTNALTGMDINAASFLIPWGVIAYTMSGGLKAAFLAAYMHVVFLMVILCIFCFAIYAGPSKNVGSIDNMYNLLEKTANTENCAYGNSCEFTLAACGAVDGNKHGSYLTMMSREGLIFGIINIVGNFGTVFLDQAYWQAAIAAKPQAAHKGYLLGGITWFSIPFTLATSLGLAAVALQLPLSKAEAGAGLVPAATAVHIFGTAGGVLILIMLFMAVTASGSHEMIAVSSIITYDVYRTYFNPEATGAQVLRFSQYAVLAFGTFSGLLSIILHQIGLSLGWVYLFMGIAIGSGVVPIALLVNWKGISAKAAICGAFGGQALAVMAWLVTCSALYTDITVDTLGMNYPMLAGNCVAILSSAFICVTMSLIWPQNYDWVSRQNISMIEKNVSWLNEDYNEAALSKSCNWIMKWGFCFSATMVLLVPIICIPIGVFNKAFFHVWVIVSLIWGLAATIYLTIAPLAEAWEELTAVVMGLFCGRKPAVTDDDDLVKPAPSQVEMPPQTAGLAH